MRRTFVTLLAAGGLLALGAWTAPGQTAPSVQAAPVEPAPTTGQQDADVCAPVQATASAHRRREEARARTIGRLQSRPRASSARPSLTTDCQQSFRMVPRGAHRAHRNAAIDRSLNQ